MDTISQLFDLAVRHHQSGNPAQAGALYRQVLTVDPSHAGVHNNLGLAFKDLGQLPEAIACYQQALQLNPNYTDAWINLSVALHNMGVELLKKRQYTEAEACLRKALSIRPNYDLAHLNLGNIFKDQGQFAEAIECFRQALLINPNNAGAFNNLGSAFVEQENLAEASECFQQALTIDPNLRIARWNRCVLRLLHGDFEGAWPDFELRWGEPEEMPRFFKQPRWDGSPLAGKTILIYSEAGLGDTIQFLRYLPMVQRLGGTLVFECQPALHGLLRAVLKANQVIRAGEPLPPFDAQIPLLSLPGLFGTTLANIPAINPYLAVDPKRIEHWRQEIARLSLFSGEPKATAAGFSVEPVASGLNIGIVWQANPNNKGYRGKSVALSNFEALARVENVRLVSLQVGPGAGELKAAPFPVIDLGNRFDPNSLEDLAAALMTMDLVVTVDTAVAHLAGALGVPVWVALQRVPCFRWLLDRSDSPWYPTIRLFRQTNPGEWGDVFQRIAAEVRHFVSKS